MHQPRIEYEGVTALNDLAHGEFGNFLKSVGLTKSQSDRFVKIYSEHSQGKLPDVGNIGMSIVYEISTLPEPERTKEHTTSMGAKLVKTWHFNAILRMKNT